MSVERLPPPKLCHFAGRKGRGVSGVTRGSREVMTTAGRRCGDALYLPARERRRWVASHPMESHDAEPSLR